MSIWGSHRIPEDSASTFSVGRLELHVRRRGREWLFALTSREPEEAGLSEPNAAETPNAGEAEHVEPVFSRYVAADSSPLLSLTPVMPDRPVVARAQTPVTLGPGVEARFYAEIPVWVRGTVGGDERRILFDTSIRQLSNTWFGGVLTGRLCYSLDRSFVFSQSELEVNEDAAVCTLRYRNQSRTPFSSGKVAIFADLLRVYRARGGLWTNEAVATVLGPEQLNLSVAETLPFPKAELEALGAPRVQAAESIVRKGLILLRTITNN